MVARGDRDHGSGAPAAGWSREIKGHPGQAGRIALLARQGGFHVGGGLVKQRQKSFVTLLCGV